MSNSSFIIARSPYRISFFGGGTDYPAWYRENGGAVLATSIDKYCYIMARWLPPFFEEKNRIVWSQIELTRGTNEIRHPAVRETLKFLGMEGVEIHHAGDLPARAGMGTSSAFTVALLHALHTLQKTRLNKLTLAREAIYLEQNVLKESVGSQDQTTSAFGGFNRIEFGGDEHIVRILPVTHSLKELEGCLMLFFTGFSRIASEVARRQIERVRENRPILERLYEMVGEGLDILLSGNSLRDFGRLLDEHWTLKKRLAENISTEYIDYLYKSALEAGAVGGKLLGAGGGGFLLLFVELDAQESVKKRLSSLLHVPFRFESGGSRIIFGVKGA